MNKHLFKLKKDGKAVGYEQSISKELLSKTKWAYKAMIIQQRFPEGKWFDVLIGSTYLKPILHDEKFPFVTKDKNGKDVFADDRIKRVPYEGDPNPRTYQTEGRTGKVAWHHGFLGWYFLDDITNNFDVLVDSEIFEAGIELIEEKEDE